MKEKTFFDEQHARTYLVGSIIRLGSEPIIINDVQYTEIKDERLRLVYYHLGDNQSAITFLPNKQIDMEPVPLGMMNGEENTWYIQRHPARGWKIGLCRDNISYHNINQNYQSTRRSIPTNSAFNSNYLRECILGVYPSYIRALKIITEGDRPSVAFSRKFAINGGGLMFKAIPETVGVCERKGPVLFKHFEFLKEVLEEDMR